jgi:DNA-binding MarR family transcriptional regulator
MFFPETHGKEGEEMENPSRQIRFLIRQINQGFFGLVACELSAYGITVPQILVLRSLKNRRLKISEISREVGLSNSTVSGIIDRLEEGGYVERVRDKEDRRVVWVARTDKFKRITNEVPVLQDQYFDSLLAGITEEERQSILKSLTLLSNHIQDKLHDRKG